MTRVVQYFRSHEGCVPHLYLDTVGLVTCAIGLMLPTPESCAALAFVRKDGAAALDPEKNDEWIRIKAMEKGHVASFYEPHCNLHLTDVVIDAEFSRVVGLFTAELRKRWPAFDSFPESAQLGLLDLIYSMGEKGFIGGYPNLCAAVDRQDWKEVAEHSVRRGVSAGRNSDCAGLFTAACLAV